MQLRCTSALQRYCVSLSERAEERPAAESVHPRIMDSSPGGDFRHDRSARMRSHANARRKASGMIHRPTSCCATERSGRKLTTPTMTSARPHAAKEKSRITKAETVTNKQHVRGRMSFRSESRRPTRFLASSVRIRREIIIITQ